MQEYLEKTEFFNYDDPYIMSRLDLIKDKANSEKELSSEIFTFVRDTVSYTPYVDFFSKSSYIAGNIITQSHSFCVPKAILLATMCRAAGIPSRLKFAVIRNNLLSKNLKTMMKTDVIYGHGLAEIFIDGKWFQATPAFDSKMSRKLDFRIVEFSGDSDAVLPGTDQAGKMHVEYLEYTESFADFPFEYYTNYVSDSYPGFRENMDLYLKMMKT